LFTVQLATFGLHGGVEVVTLVEALERDTRTVERVRIPVRGAAVNLMTLATQLTCMVGATRNGVPRRHLHGAPRRTTVDVQSTPGPGRCAATQGMRARRPDAGEQAPNDAIPLRGREMRH